MRLCLLLSIIAFSPLNILAIHLPETMIQFFDDSPHRPCIVWEEEGTFYLKIFSCPEDPASNLNHIYTIGKIEHFSGCGCKY